MSFCVYVQNVGYSTKYCTHNAQTHYWNKMQWMANTFCFWVTDISVINVLCPAVCRVFGQDSGRSDEYGQQERTSKDPAQEEWVTRHVASVLAACSYSLFSIVHNLYKKYRLFFRFCHYFLFISTWDKKMCKAGSCIVDVAVERFVPRQSDDQGLKKLNKIQGPF